MPLAPEMIQVRSSNIREIGLAFFTSGVDPDPPAGAAGHLYVKFKSGKTYVFNNFPGTLWADFRNAASKGTYFRRQIRGKFAYSMKY